MNECQLQKYDTDSLHLQVGSEEWCQKRPQAASNLAMASDLDFSPPEVPEPTFLENLLRYGLFLGAIFQLICVLAIIVPIPKSYEAAHEESRGREVLSFPVIGRDVWLFGEQGGCSAPVVHDPFESDRLYDGRSKEDSGAAALL
ncbi:hypothetical protein P7K49_009690 [Saguinus oedipus]|uniref:Protein MANBAL n=1 Tax=Saguinus oedipus TaxID=9490 RepID=A0ABQ9VM31_SAGOE|nr:hypothetical protein P7K49_009690 [Saguinus oedipus]